MTTEKGKPVASVSVVRRQGYSHELRARHHTLIADEPQSRGGSDTGPTPAELLALSLASCTAITVEMYADRKGWDVGKLEVEVDYGEHEAGRPRYDVVVTIPEALSDEQCERLRVIAGKCPVHRVLNEQAIINDRIDSSSRR